MDLPKPGSVQDLATLAKLDDNILLDELRIRYNSDEIYVSSVMSYIILSTFIFSTILKQQDTCRDTM
jgi:hypothetical protein